MTAWQDRFGQMRRPARCEHCRAPLRFGRTENGKWLPLEAEPLPRESVPESLRRRLVGDRALHDTAAMNAQLVWVTHFAVCPAKLTTIAMAKLSEEWPDLAGRARRYGARETTQPSAGAQTYTLRGLLPRRAG